MIRTKRAYEPASSEDGYRVLVDRLWPRGVSKEDARLDAWMKEVAPSDDLREWFDHDPERWEEFGRRYREELERAGNLVQRLLDLARQGRLTLVLASKDVERSSAALLKAHLEQRLEA